MRNGRYLRQRITGAALRPAAATWKVSGRLSLVETKATDQNCDLVIDAEECRVDDGLPCRQLVVLDIGCSGFDASTML